MEREDIYKDDIINKFLIIWELVLDWSRRAVQGCRGDEEGRVFSSISRDLCSVVRERKQKGDTRHSGECNSEAVFS